MSSHEPWPAVVSLRTFERRVLFAAGCVYLGSESSHHQYRTPGGHRFHLCGKSIGPQQQRAIRRLLATEAAELEQQQQQGGQDNHAE